MRKEMTQLEFFLVAALVGMTVALVASLMWYATISSSLWGTLIAHAIIKTFPVPFIGTVALAWLNQFKWKRRHLATVWMCLAGTVPLWCWVIGNQLTDLLRKMQ